MPSHKVQQLIDVFRNHFQEEVGGSPPLALRQESTDVVFTALLEDDAPPTPGPSPLLIDEGMMSADPFADLAAQFGPAMSAALGAQGGPGDDLAAMMGMGGPGEGVMPQGGVQALLPGDMQSPGNAQPPADLATLLGEMG